MLVTEKKGATHLAFQAYAKQHGAADLMVPGEIFVLEKLPVLGSGKLDQVHLARLIRERSANPFPFVAT